MGQDNQWTALGPALVGFQTSSTSINHGAEITGNTLGILGHCDAGDAVHGQSGSPAHSGVWGENTAGGTGVSGSTNSTNASGTAGVWGDNPGGGIGVKGTSAGGDAVVGISKSTAHAGVAAVNDSGGGTAFGVWARGSPAGHFEGNVEVTGDICLINQDCAEDFEVSCGNEIDPGTVMVIEEEDTLTVSEYAYDKRVAGVISGAADLKPGIILGKQQPRGQRAPIALLGKVYCKVDARNAPIEVGDLLTTSATPGYAMKAADPMKSFGAVIGKALRGMENGLGLIPILIALQ